MGYMAVARVESAGPGAADYRPGERLLTSTGHGSHALLDLNASAAAPVWRLPDDAPAHHLVFARMAKTAITALCRAEVTLAQSVVVVGLGIIGQITLRLFEAAGAWPLAGIDPVAMRREAAQRGGATVVLDAGAAGHG